MDFAGSSIEAIALRLDALSIEWDGSSISNISVSVTLIVTGDPTACGDLDGDGFGSPGPYDCVRANCPEEFNPRQDDADADGIGDACDAYLTDPNPDLTQCWFEHASSSAQTFPPWPRVWIGTGLVLLADLVLRSRDFRAHYTDSGILPSEAPSGHGWLMAYTLYAFASAVRQPRELPTMRRGRVVGEVGSFGVKRTASVEALSDALLIRFDAEDLERLRRCDPPIAATVYRNLNRIQAKRLESTTAKLQVAG